MDKLIWEGTNSDGDKVTVWRSESGDYPIAYHSDKERFAGATVIPKEALDALIAARSGE